MTENNKIELSSDINPMLSRRFGELFTISIIMF